MFRRLMVAITLLTLLSIPAFARYSDPWAQADYLPGRVIVTFQPEVTLTAGTTLDGSNLLQSGQPALDNLLQEAGAKTAKRLVSDALLSKLKIVPDLQHTYVLKFDDHIPVLDFIDRLAENPAVVRVEPDLLRRTFRAPNDVLWNSQWDKRIMGADEVWDISTGSRDIICVGIDTGVDWNHPDLTPALWVNPGEDLDGDGAAWTETWYPGDLYDDLNGVDDDSNGYVDDFLGWDFIVDIDDCAPGEDCDSQGDNDMSGVNDHGTHVAGIMSATGNNNIGVAGMSWVGRLMTLRAGYQADDGQGYIPESASIPAILYAAANGAKVLNMSYGGPGTSPGAQAAINAAWDAGCLLFAASGNDGSSTPQYPAAYENVIAVNATNNLDRLANWSNRGTWTDLCAPGSDPGIMSTVINGYAAFWGTSMASPNAAGAAALIWSVFPQMTNTQVRDLMFETAHNIASLNPGIPPSHLGYGRVDAQAAVASLYPQLEISASSTTETSGDADGRLEAGENAHLLLTVTNQPGWADGVDLTAVVSSADARVSVINGTWAIGDLGGGQSVNNTATPALLSISSALDTAFWCAVRVTFSSPNGYQGERELTLRVGRGRILLVDDDGAANYEQSYLAMLNGAGATDLWRVAEHGALTALELAHYQSVVWSCGDEATATLTANDQTLLADYLNGGGNLVLIGQNVDEDLRGTTFYSDYVHAQSENQNGDRQLSGVSGDPVSDGMSLLLVGSCANNGQLSPSRISATGGAVPIFNYSQGGVGAVRYEGTYKLAYFAFALEAACGSGGTTPMETVLRSALDWTGALPVGDEPRPALPEALELLPNYPNPFNPSTVIPFTLPAAAHVRLQVFDVLGRQVATLVDAPLSAGLHRVSFDGHDLASGVYLVRLEAGAASRAAKMALVK